MVNEKKIDGHLQAKVIGVQQMSPQSQKNKPLCYQMAWDF